MDQCILSILPGALRQNNQGRRMCMNMVTVRGESHSVTKAGTTTVIREEMLASAVQVISCTNPPGTYRGVHYALHSQSLPPGTPSRPH